MCYMLFACDSVKTWEWCTSREKEATKWEVISAVAPTAKRSVVGASWWSSLWSCAEGLLVIVSSIFSTWVVGWTGSYSKGWWYCWDESWMVVSDGGCDGISYSGVDDGDASVVADAGPASCSMSWCVGNGQHPSSTSCTPFNRREC